MVLIEKNTIAFTDTNIICFDEAKHKNIENEPCTKIYLDNNLSVIIPSKYNVVLDDRFHKHVDQLNINDCIEYVNAYSIASSYTSENYYWKLVGLSINGIINNNILSFEFKHHYDEFIRLFEAHYTNIKLIVDDSINSIKMNEQVNTIINDGINNIWSLCKCSLDDRINFSEGLFLSLNEQYSRCKINDSINVNINTICSILYSVGINVGINIDGKNTNIIKLNIDKDQQFCCKVVKLEQLGNCECFNAYQTEYINLGIKVLP